MIDKDEMDREINDFCLVAALASLIVILISIFGCSTPTDPDPQKFELKLHICGIDYTQCRDTTIN